MAKKTLQQKFVAALIQRGETEVPSKSGRYLTLTRRVGGFYFVGYGGALRYGWAASVSTPVSDAFKKLLIAPPQPHEVHLEK